MTENFRKLVLKMRQAQKQYFKQPTRFLLNECKSLEHRVDRWLEENAREEARAVSWTRSAKSSELPGAYNLSDEPETEKGKAA